MPALLGKILLSELERCEELGQPTSSHSPVHAAASRGNKTESARTEVAALARAVPVAAFHVYFLVFQTFVCVVEGAA